VTGVFLTGFPGFLGSRLVERLLERYDADVPIHCLIQSSYREAAERRRETVAAAAGADPERVRLHEGDITEADLALGDDYDALQAETTELFHLAAVYDLAVDREVGMAVNVSGTEHVLEFARGCPDLERFQYVSTCYVSGRYDGVFTEDHLDEDQSFNNHYEETKFLAEKAVQAAMDEGLPATIYRPAITVGDSETGETQKYDGPYYVLQWLLRQPRALAAVPTVGNPDRHQVNVVPRDFVVDAIAHLSGLDRSAGEVYQLCDPNPATVSEMLRLFADATGRRVVPIPLTRRLAKWSLSSLPPVQSIMRIEPATVDYFVQPTSYTCENTVRDLQGSGIECPPLSAYVDELVAFMRDHPEISPDAMT